MSIVPSGSPVVPSTLQSQTTGTTPASRAVNEANMQSILDGLTRLDSDVDAVNASLAAEIATRDANDDAHDLKLNKLAAEYFFSGSPLDDGSSVANGSSLTLFVTLVPVPAGKVARIVEYGCSNNQTGSTLEIYCDKGSTTPLVLVASNVVASKPTYSGGNLSGVHYIDGTGLTFYDNSASGTMYYPNLEVRFKNTTGVTAGFGEAHTAWVRIQIT